MVRMNSVHDQNVKRTDYEISREIGRHRVADPGRNIVTRTDMTGVANVFAFDNRKAAAPKSEGQR